jgi:predicted PurR-regulated permease PerM
MLSSSDQRETSQHGITPTSVWTRRLIILLTILATITLVGVALWGASHIITSSLIFAIAALIAYAIAPAVDLFQRVLPRALAILVVYLIALILLGLLLYMLISTTLAQLISLVKSIGTFLTPGNNGQDSPLVQILKRFGMTDTQIHSFATQLGLQLTSIAGTIASGVLPLITGIAGGALNILLTVVISIYLLIDGSRAIRWLRNRTPTTQRGRINSLLSALQHVVGGYIRGQFVLSLVIGVIVGVGLTILRFPYAALIGVLSFITEFIPVLGTIVCGTIAILLALTQGWLMTILVLAFFIVVHVFEGYILAPRLVGKAVGLNPVVCLIALTVGGELFGPWGAIFASPTAGLIQAFAVAFWINYRRTHSDEFPQDKHELAGKQPEEPSTAAAISAPTKSDDTKGEIHTEYTDPPKLAV